MKKFVKSALAAFYTAWLKRTAKSIGFGCRANGPVRAANLYISDDCHFNGLRVTGRGKVTIGSHFHSGEGLVILTGFHDYESDRLPYGDNVITKDVEIGRNVWVGMDVCILGGVKIGDGAIIQARSVVVSDIPTLAIAGGHPAKVFKYRNENHYKRLDQTLAPQL